jgi:CheY-like chemotaxis protein
MPKLLLVEDDTERLKGMIRAASAEGRDIKEASSRGQAIDILKSEDVDLVVTDIALHSPGDDTDGFEVLEAARAKDVDLPVILISAYVTERTHKRARSEGAFQLIDRGFNPSFVDSELRRQIDIALKVRQAAMILAEAKRTERPHGSSQPS